MKRPWHSRTAWMLGLMLGTRLFTIFTRKPLHITGEEFQEIGEIVILFFLRLSTKEPIEMKTSKTVLLVLCVFLAGCAGVDIKIPADSNVSPMDTNYKTLYFRTVCDGVEKETELGLSGCWLPFDSDLKKSSITIASPFPATVDINSDETGYSERFMLEPRKPRTFLLSELVPIQTEQATFSFYVQWQKPPELKIDVPVRGQAGTFYYKLGPKDSKPATLRWSPQGPNLDGRGMVYAQFRARAALTDPAEVREPIRLTIETTTSVSDGRYQLINKAKGIGVDTTPFVGDEILIPKASITGPGQVGGYMLFGWAVTQSFAQPVSLLELDNDFVAGVSLYRYDTAKLTADIHFTEKEVCYLTEASVFLIAITGNEEAHNAPKEGKGCFPIPEGQADMFFMTNVGRAAVAWVDGPNRIWKLKN